MLFFLIRPDDPCQAKLLRLHEILAGDAGGMTIAIEHCDHSPRTTMMEVFMASETEFFYLLLLTLVMLIVHLVLSMKARRRDHR